MDENKPKSSDIIMRFQNTRNKEILKALIKEKKHTHTKDKQSKRLQLLNSNVGDWKAMGRKMPLKFIRKFMSKLYFYT